MAGFGEMYQITLDLDLQSRSLLQQLLFGTVIEG